MRSSITKQIWLNVLLKTAQTDLDPETPANVILFVQWTLITEQLKEPTMSTFY